MIKIKLQFYFFLIHLVEIFVIFFIFFAFFWFDFTFRFVRLRTFDLLVFLTFLAGFAPCRLVMRRRRPRCRLICQILWINDWFPYWSYILIYGIVIIVHFRIVLIIIVHIWIRHLFLYNFFFFFATFIRFTRFYRFTSRLFKFS